jgi:hypothetical protein
MGETTSSSDEQRAEGISAVDPAATDAAASGRDGPRPAGDPMDTSLSAVLGQLERAGWEGQFMPLEGGDIRCLTCRSEFPATGADADEMRRLEGASDPADMLIVVPLVCPACTTKGVVVANFGPDASGADADVVAAFSRTPATGHGVGQPPGATA